MLQLESCNPRAEKECAMSPKLNGRVAADGAIALTYMPSGGHLHYGAIARGQRQLIGWKPAFWCNSKA
jgi:hypothetical protein